MEKNPGAFPSSPIQNLNFKSQLFDSVLVLYVLCYINFSYQVFVKLKFVRLQFREFYSTFCFAYTLDLLSLSL